MTGVTLLICNFLHNVAFPPPPTVFLLYKSYQKTALFRGEITQELDTLQLTIYDNNILSQLYKLFPYPPHFTLYLKITPCFT